MKILSVLISTALLGLAGPVAASVTFVDAGAFTDTRGGVGDEDFGPSDSAIASSLPGSPLIAASRFSGTVGTASFAATGTSTVTFVDAARGTMSFLAAAEASNQPGDTFAIARSISDTEYTFSVDRNSRLSIDYSLDVSGTSPAAYIVFARLDANGNFADTLFSVADERNAGSQGFQFGAGSYYLRFGNNVRTAFSVANPGSDADSISGSLDFSIAAVPEPSSWAMMIMGFGVVGAGLRTARRQNRAMTVAI